jgi:murein tripeptide amidase MpaA
MRKSLVTKELVLGIILLFVTASIVSALNTKQKHKSDDFQNISSTVTQMDEPSILPDWDDGDYHDYDATREKLIDFNDNYHDLVSVFSIGKSVLNRDIWCIRITNENNNTQKYSCLYDGCIHGNEWETTEACLYFAEYLLINFENNETISALLNKSEIYFVPIVNPDGRQRDDRFNENGIDLNRNFDVNFGRLL